MEACSRRAVTTSRLWGLSIHSKDLWHLVFRTLPKLLGIRFGLLKKFQIDDESVGKAAIESEIVFSELPQDVLAVIFANLEIPDLVRAGSVCASWHAAYTDLRNLGLYKQYQTPCLFYTSESAGENVGCLYSLVERREYKLTVPEPPIRRRIIIGSSNGWLITADERSELHLLNPFIGEQVALPSVITIEHVKPIVDDFGTVQMYQLSYYSGEKVYRESEAHALNDLREHLYYKAFIFPELSTGSYIVVLIHYPYCQLSFARAGDDKWTWMPPGTSYRDCTYMDGLLYALTSVGRIDAFDLTGCTVTRKVIMEKVKSYIYESMYLIPAPWGDLLQVWRIVDHPNVGQNDNDGAPGIQQDYVDDDDDDDDDDDAAPMFYITHEILIYRVDMAAKELVKINSLPHHMLFLGHNRSFCLHAADHPQLEANHAYYTDDHEELIVVSRNGPRDIGVINLESQRRKEVVSQLWCNQPCPTWIIPNLTEMSMSFSK